MTSGVTRCFTDLSHVLAPFAENDAVNESNQVLELRLTKPE